MKTNKSYKKRIRLTKTGKVKVRKPGQNHFNAKESGEKRLAKKNKIVIPMSNKKKSRFLVNIK